MGVRGSAPEQELLRTLTLPGGFQQILSAPAAPHRSADVVAGVPLQVGPEVGHVAVPGGDPDHQELVDGPAALGPDSLPVSAVVGKVRTGCHSVAVDDQRSKNRQFPFYDMA